MKSALILYPNQLYELDQLPVVDRVYLVEEPLLFGNDPEFGQVFHKQKLVLQRASMRRYAEEILWPNGYEVEYLQCIDDISSGSALAKAAFDGAGEVLVFDPMDHRLWQRLSEASKSLEVHVPLKRLSTPNFYLSETDIEHYFKDNVKAGFADFYQWQRERFNVLIDDDYRPLGGHWMYQPKITARDAIQAPGVRSFGDSPHVVEAIDYVETHFPDNPGLLANFIWPTSHQEALLWLDDFFAQRFSKYFDNLDRIDSESVWLYRSGISAMLDSGLLDPRYVVDAAMAYARDARHNISLESLESFVRQIIGQREFARCQYLRGKSGIKDNTGSSLSGSWWSGETGLVPLDKIITKTRLQGYVTDGERMLIGGFMISAGVSPGEIKKWFTGNFIDASTWQVEVGVERLYQLTKADNPTRLSLMTSAGLMEISDLTKGSWCDTWDGLFWRYIDSNRAKIANIPRTGKLLLKRYDTMDPARKRIIGYRADDFLAQNTQK